MTKKEKRGKRKMNHLQQFHGEFETAIAAGSKAEKRKLRKAYFSQSKEERERRVREDDFLPVEVTYEKPGVTKCKFEDGAEVELTIMRYSTTTVQERSTLYIPEYRSIVEKTFERKIPQKSEEVAYSARLVNPGSGLDQQRIEAVRRQLEKVTGIPLSSDPLYGDVAFFVGRSEERFPNLKPYASLIGLLGMGQLGYFTDESILPLTPRNSARLGLPSLEDVVLRSDRPRWEEIQIENPYLIPEELESSGIKETFGRNTLESYGTSRSIPEHVAKIYIIPGGKQ